MKYLFLHILFCLFYVQSYAVEKHALVIAIANYEDEKWSQISAMRDTSYIKALLTEQNFDSKNVVFLVNEEATKKAVLVQFENILKRVNEGDVLFVQFCCHGQRVEDLNGDEHDGFDEALVMYDAYHAATATYKGQNHLLDDEIGVFISKARKKLGKAGSFNLFIDACYSGSISRYTMLSRGAEVPFIITGKPIIQNQEFVLNREDNITDINNPDAEGLSGYAIFSACQNNEESKEMPGEDGKSVGALTYALVNAFKRIQKNDTYRTLFDYIYRTIASKSDHRKHPSFEGNLDNIIFSSNVVSGTDYYRVYEKLNSEESTYLVEGGRFTGLFENAILGFYKAGSETYSESDLIAEGTVIISKDIMSYVKVTSVLGQTEGLLFARVKQIKPGIPKNKLSVKLESEDTVFVNGIKNYLRNENFIEYDSPQYSVYITSAEEKILIKCIESVLGEFENSDTLVFEKIKRFLYKYFLWKTLLEFTGNTAGDIVGLKIDFKNQQIKNGYFEIHSGDVIKVEINNKSKKDLFFYLLDFAPEGGVKCHTNKDLEKIPAGSIKTVSLPFRDVKNGFEFFRFVFSSERIMFNEIINTINSVDSRKISEDFKDNSLDLNLIINGFRNEDSRSIEYYFYTYNLTVLLMQ